MCMITFVPGGTDIPVDGIKNGAIINDDGHGWAVAAGDTLLVGKSMIFQEALDGFLQAREDLGRSAVALFHSRFGTHGEYGEYNVHPFYVNDEDTVMAHNGILPVKFHPEGEDRRSDTRIFVDRYKHLANNPNGVPSRRGGAMLGNIIGGGNKLVFLSVRSGQPKVRIVNVNQGIQTEGVWYSNDGYRTSYAWLGYARRRSLDNYEWVNDRARETGWSDPLGDGFEGKELVPYESNCPECGSEDIDREMGMCLECLSCLDCHDNFAYCMCWRPSGMRSPMSEVIPTIG